MTTERTEGKRSLWAARRARLGVPLRMLAKASGVAAPYLSLMEQGRGIPTAEEYDRIIAALDSIEERAKTGDAA
jgi:predicted transcriptional regulator